MSEHWFGTRWNIDRNTLGVLEHWSEHVGRVGTLVGTRWDRAVMQEHRSEHWLEHV
jgi:hypothetical protein